MKMRKAVPWNTLKILVCQVPFPLPTAPFKTQKELEERHSIPSTVRLFYFYIQRIFRTWKEAEGCCERKQSWFYFRYLNSTSLQVQRNTYERHIIKHIKYYILSLPIPHVKKKIFFLSTFPRYISPFLLSWYCRQFQGSLFSFWCVFPHGFVQWIFWGSVRIQILLTLSHNWLLLPLPHLVGRCVFLG